MVRRRAWFYSAGLFALALAIFYPVLHRAAYAPKPFSDYSLHTGFAEHMRVEGITLPHFLYHVLTIAVGSILSIDLRTAGFLLTLIALAIVPLLAARIFAEKEGSIRYWLGLLVSVAGPISLWAIGSHHLYYGFLNMTTYHNPTMNLMKPLALGHFLLIANHLGLRPEDRTSKRNTFRPILLSWVLLILATLAKPSYTMCLLPAVVSYVLVDRYVLVSASDRNAPGIRPPNDWQFWIVGVILPSALMLAWQFYFTFLRTSPDYQQGKILFAPLDAVRSVSLSLAPKLLSSIAFPLAVTLLLRRHALRSREYILSLFIFLFGAAFFYLLAEDGYRISHLNFAWGASIGVFLWFLTSLALLWRHRQEMLRSRLLFCYVMLALHIVSGLVWYVTETIEPGSFL